MVSDLCFELNLSDQTLTVPTFNFLFEFKAFLIFF